MGHTHSIYMKRCFQLAAQGLGSVSPNPLVGCVIVHDGKIIGEGYHIKYGEAHAEVNAINAVKDKSLLGESTLYVNLEPCSHYGKTPPCSELIIAHKIPVVYIANTDTNPLVSGKGIKKLTEAACKVYPGILQDEGRHLNRRFFTFQEKKRPYIILKWAQTKDGYIDIIRTNKIDQRPTWITNENTRVLVHKWRTEEDAICIGTQTALKDNPSLTARDWHGKQPLRIVLDRQLSLPKNLNIFDKNAHTLIFNALENKIDKNLNFIQIPFDENVPESILNKLFDMNISSVIIEGGSKLINSFVKKNLWDEARIFTGNINFKEGIKAPSVNGSYTQRIEMGTDILEILHPCTTF